MHRFMIRIWNVKFSHYVIVGELKEQNLDSVLSNKKTLISLYDGRNDNFMLIYKGAAQGADRLSQILSQV